MYYFLLFVLSLFFFIPGLTESRKIDVNLLHIRLYGICSAETEKYIYINLEYIPETVL